ncbi:hypothetical protein [Nitrospina gracilis]|uniref:hypothetical protein n=1 Tax=Nitrospina gracilis TaxID=35801 RepID=UPI000349DDAC|nr:hypothetical protein [Nitrospina gracilis]
MQKAVWLQDLEPPLQKALSLHLADLGLFKAVSENEWRLVGFEGLMEDEVAVREFMKKRVSELACTDAGFALVYF